MNYKQILTIIIVLTSIVGTITWVNAQTGGIRLHSSCQATNIDVVYGANSYEGRYTNYRAWITAGECEKIIEGRVQTTSNVANAIEQDIRARGQSGEIYLSKDGFGELEVQYRGRFRI